MISAPEVIAILRNHEGELRRMGVAQAWVFGSVARGDNDVQSDIDICVDIDPEFRISIFDFAKINYTLEDIFHTTVDLCERAAFNPRIRAHVERDALNAF